MEGLTAELVLGRMVGAVQDVRERLGRATTALDAHCVPYAVVGENAAAVWVARIDEAAVRNTPAVEVMVRRPDLPAARRALESAGFVYRTYDGKILFPDGVDAMPRDAVRLFFANEKTRPGDFEAAPDIEPNEIAPPFRVLALEPLVRTLLSTCRNIDHVMIRDLIGVGQIDETWPARFPPELAERLQGILDTPYG